MPAPRPHAYGVRGGPRVSKEAKTKSDNGTPIEEQSLLAHPLTLPSRPQGERNVAGKPLSRA